MQKNFYTVQYTLTEFPTASVYKNRFSGAIVNRSRFGLLTISWQHHSQEGEFEA